jgi:peptide/nickel transport system substrate-binding protein
VKRQLFVLLTLTVLASMMLASCAPGGGGAVVQTEGLEEQAFAPTKYESPDCEYGGEFSSIEAVDENTVKFVLCVPDPAFPSKIAFTSFAIQPREWLESTGGNGELLEKPIGTGPYYVAQWERGNQVVLKRFDGYWGDKAQNETLVFRWGTESAQRLLELQSGTVDGIDNVGPDDFATVEGDSNLQLLVRPALNTMYIGFNNNFAPFDNEMVRQAIAMSIDRQRIVDNFYPAGSEVASHFTPCSIPNGCVGEEWYEFDPAAGKALLAEAGFPDGFETVLNYRDVVRGYLPDPNVVAQDIQAQLLENLNITVNIEVMESGAFLDAADSGQLEGIHLLGWGADYPDQTNFLGYHFGAGSSDQFGAHWDDITAALDSGAQLADDDARAPFYTTANDLIKQHVPMIPVAHGGSALAYKASVTGAFASPLGNEEFEGMSNGTDTFVWMQNAEPISLYCADETDGESLRACEQVTQSLLGYEKGGTAVIPALAESYEANAELTEWTFHLRPNVKYHNGFTLDAADVVTSLALQWDAAHPLHTGNTGGFSYWSGLFGVFMNAPAE